MSDYEPAMGIGIPDPQDCPPPYGWRCPDEEDDDD